MPVLGAACRVPCMKARFISCVRSRPVCCVHTNRYLGHQASPLSAHHHRVATHAAITNATTIGAMHAAAADGHLAAASGCRSAGRLWPHAAAAGAGAASMVAAAAGAAGGVGGRPGLTPQQDILRLR